MATNVSPLFQHLELSPDLVLSNRIVVGPVTRNRAVSPLSNPPYAPNAFDNKNIVPVANEFMTEYYAQRARGGAGLIISEGILVSRQGTQWENAPGLWSDLQIEGWIAVTNTVHREGSIIFAQLWHVGRVAQPEMLEQIRSGKPAVAPSAIPAAGGRGRSAHVSTTPTAIEDPNTIIEEFYQAAIRAKAAGFDGIELQYGGGFLPQQFIDFTANNRTDKWGGSVENRSRFPLEILRRCLTLWDSKRIGVKFMPGGGHNDIGMPEKDTRETYGYLLAEIEKANVGYIHLLRTNDEIHALLESHERGTHYDMLEHFAPLVKNAKLFLNGAVTVEEATKLIQDGTISAAIFARKWMNNPDFANRVEQGLPLDTAPFPLTTMYSWTTTPAEGYTDVIPEGGFAHSIRRQRSEKTTTKGTGSSAVNIETTRTAAASNPGSMLMTLYTTVYNFIKGRYWYRSI